MKFSVLALWLFGIAVGFGGGNYWHEREYGSVRLGHFVNIEGDCRNYGQKTIDIEFPKSMRLAQIRLPDGGVYPEPDKLRWVEVIGKNGETKDWLDRLSFGTYEWGTEPAKPPETCTK